MSSLVLPLRLVAARDCGAGHWVAWLTTGGQCTVPVWGALAAASTADAPSHCPLPQRGHVRSPEGHIWRIRTAAADLRSLTHEIVLHLCMQRGHVRGPEDHGTGPKEMRDVRALQMRCRWGSQGTSGGCCCCCAGMTELSALQAASVSASGPPARSAALPLTACCPWAHRTLPQVTMVTDEESSELGPPGSPLGNVFALGDCCADLDNPLPALAQARRPRGGGGVAQGCPAHRMEAAWCRPGRPSSGAGTSEALAASTALGCSCKRANCCLALA